MYPERKCTQDYRVLSCGRFLEIEAVMDPSLISIVDRDNEIFFSDSLDFTNLDYYCVEEARNTCGQ